MDTTNSKSKIERLNQSFVSWLEKQSIAHPLSIWSGGLQDYLKYAKQISEETLGTSSDSIQSSNPLPTAAPITNLAPASFQTKKLESFSLPKQTETLPSTTDAPKPFSFTSKPLAPVGPSPSGFSFGPKPTAPSTSTNSTTTTLGGFIGFGGATASVATPQFGAFNGGLNSFSKPKAAEESGSSGNGGGVGGDEGEGDGEGEEVQQLEPVEILRNEKDTDEILYEVASKLFRFDKSSGEWKDIGKGTLRVTRDTTQGTSSKKRILIRNNLGKITLNANIFKGMGVKQSGKNGIQFFVPDETSTIHLYLIKVKPEDLDRTLNFISQIEKSL
jgi:hypothetical protein